MQKLITLAIFSPLPIIIILILIGLSIVWRRRKRGILLIAIGIFLYFSSTDYFINSLLYPLEKTYPQITQSELEKGDAYILLGGGITLDTAGGNVPTVYADSRILTTAQYYFKYPKKIYISGGMVLQNTASESSIYKKELVALGVKDEDIILEEKSKNTKENAQYIGESLKENNTKSVILITSAFHMDRSFRIFQKFIPDIEFYAAPCNYFASKINDRTISFIPSYYNFVKLQFVMWEIVGNIYYQIKY